MQQHFVFKKHSKELLKQLLIVPPKIGFYIGVGIFILFILILLTGQSPQATCGTDSFFGCFIESLAGSLLIACLFTFICIVNILKRETQFPPPQIQLSEEGLKLKRVRLGKESESEIIPWHLMRKFEIKSEKLWTIEIQDLVMICPSGMLKEVSRMRSNEEVEIYLPWPVENMEHFKQVVFQFVSEEHPLHQFLKTNSPESSGLSAD